MWSHSESRRKSRLVRTQLERVYARYPCPSILRSISHCWAVSYYLYPWVIFFFFLMIRRPPSSTLFPYPPLFGSRVGQPGRHEPRLLARREVARRVREGDEAHAQLIEPAPVAAGREPSGVEEWTEARVELALPAAGDGEALGDVHDLPVRPGRDDLDAPGRIAVAGEEADERRIERRAHGCVAGLHEVVVRGL